MLLLKEALIRSSFYPKMPFKNSVVLGAIGEMRSTRISSKELQEVIRENKKKTEKPSSK